VEKIVLIVAGGSGKRMNSEIPKQFLLLKGLPVLMHTVDKFYQYDSTIRIIVVLPEDQEDSWNTLCYNHQFSIKHEIRSGGQTRFHSVRKNLDIIPDRSLIAIHDGVRPLVSIETITRCFQTASETGNAIPCVEIPETMRLIDKGATIQVDRTKYRLIQTPQVFRGDLIKKAYLQDYQVEFTDDAGVAEKDGNTINLVDGNAENIKITIEKDLIIASAML
jgi:2-C-methyl-D-erythritol 4-phosphate cytidylyltransferase